MEFMTVVRESSKGFQAARLALCSLGAATMIAHAFTGAGFGFHGDELQFMDDARHPAWGYVAYPPMTPFFARLSLDLLGTSIAGFRFFASLAQAVAIVLTGLMAREMGGGVGALRCSLARRWFRTLWARAPSWSTFLSITFAGLWRPGSSLSCFGRGMRDGGSPWARQSDSA
jgi:hypothetical protein